jgi:uncharacterized membrane protein
MTPDNSPETPVAAPEPAPVLHHRILARLRNYFLTGLVLVGPLFITAYLTWSFVTWVDGLVRPLIPPHLRPETYLPVNIPGTGLIIALASLTLLGFLTANLVGRTLLEFGELILDRMPVIRPIYRTMKQIFETVFSTSGSAFRKVGLVEFPAPGMWSLVFLSQPPSEEISTRLPGDDHVSVFLPCTPNPTTGFFFYLPRKDIIELDIKVEDAMTLLISAGMIQPNAAGGDPQKKLAALAATARAAQAAREADQKAHQVAS